MTNLYLFRHAESTMNVQPHIVGGRSNHVDITETGIAQAEIAGKWLHDSPINPDIIYSSPAKRTLQTAHHTLKAAGVTMDIIIDDRLQELAQGIKEGADREETYPPEVKEQIAQETFDFKFPGGESIREVMDRMYDYALDMHVKHTDQTIVVFSHGLAIRSLVGKINNYDHGTIIHKLTADNTSHTHIEITDDGAQVHYTGAKPLHK